MMGGLPAAGWCGGAPVPARLPRLADSPRLLHSPHLHPPQLVRRVLGFPGAPAALSMHFFAYWHAKPKLRGKEPALWYNTGEDDLAVIAQYYDLPVASLRCGRGAQEQALPGCVGATCCCSVPAAAASCGVGRALNLFAPALPGRAGTPRCTACTATSPASW